MIFLNQVLVVLHLSAALIGILFLFEVVLHQGCLYKAFKAFCGFTVIYYSWKLSSLMLPKQCM